MNQQELIKIVTQLNTLDLKGEQKNEMTAKILQMAADSVTLETLKSLLAPDKSKQTAQPVFEEAVRPLGRKSKLGFTLTKKEIKSMPEKQKKYLPVKTESYRIVFIKACTKHITVETASKYSPVQKILMKCVRSLRKNYWRK